MRPSNTAAKILAVCTLFILFISLQPASSEEYRTFYRGARPLGMGGAFSAVADDHNARYYNPAGLAGSGTFHLGLFNPFISVSENSLDLMQDFSDANTDDPEEVNELMKKYVGENNNIKFALDPYFGFKVGNVGLALTALGIADVNINIHNPVYPEAHVQAVADYGLMLGAGIEIPMVSGLKVGASLKALNRESLDQVYTAIDIADDDVDFGDRIDDDMESGTGIGLDIGVLYTMKEIVPLSELNLAFTAQNLPDIDYGDALDCNSQYNVGVALKQHFGILTLIEAADYMDITDNLVGDDSMEKKLHLGVEAKIPVLAVRAGMNQGYFTAGATLDFKVIKLDVVTYGEEVGVMGGQKEDRRLALQLSMGWLW